MANKAHISKDVITSYFNLRNKKYPDGKHLFKPNEAWSYACFMHRISH